jgi:FkbM family methyltransferase
MSQTWKMMGQRFLGPKSFYWARRAYMFSLYALGRVQERDFVLLHHWNRRITLTLVDVGANGGQSALAMSLVCPSATIVSFEANEKNISDLRLIQRILGKRYSFHHVALSDVCGIGILKIPISGRRPAPGESSLEAEAFDDPTLVDRIGEVTRVDTQRVELKTLDAFNLPADFIKIDVQGHELHVLRGAAETIRRHRPILMIERNGLAPTIIGYLGEYGYKTFEYDSKTNDLVPTENPKSINYFALLPNHLTEFGRLCTKAVRQTGEPESLLEQ